MVAKETLIGGVLAATDKLVWQAGRGDWKSVDKTIEQRRMFMDALKNEAPKEGEHDFMKALRSAVAESEAAIDTMRKAR